MASNTIKMVLMSLHNFCNEAVLQGSNLGITGRRLLEAEVLLQLFSDSENEGGNGGGREGVEGLEQERKAKVERRDLG